MYSPHDSLCSHRLDFSIRKSPDHRLLASPRGLSQLATSFIAFLRQGIHTHALSSLTIKFTLHTSRYSGRLPPHSPSPALALPPLSQAQAQTVPVRTLRAVVLNLCFIMPVSIQFSKILALRFAKRRSHPPVVFPLLGAGFYSLSCAFMW